MCCATGALVSAQTAQISLGPQTVQPDGTITAPVLLASEGLQVSAVQFDLTFDSTVNTIAPNPDSSSNSSSKGVSNAHTNGPGIRVLLTGMNQNAIPDGPLASIVIAPVSSGFSGVLNLSNAAASDPNGSAVAISGPAAPPPPVSLTIVNAAAPCEASSTPCTPAGAIAPGEIVSLFQSGILPASVQTSAPDPNVSVSFNGTSVALLYTGPNQINAVTPFGLAGQSSAAVVVSYQGQQVAQTTVSVAPSAPAVFTVDASGMGQAVVFNQDGTPNSASNPAAIGSTVSLYATGAGLFQNPALTDGEIVPAGSTSTPALKVFMVLGGGDVNNVPYTGPTPGMIAGILQIKFVIGSNVSPGSAVPLWVNVGGVRSPTVTIAVR